MKPWDEEAETLEDEDEIESLWDNVVPSDLIFCVAPMFGEDVIVITPKAYFQMNGYLFDQHICASFLDDIVESMDESSFEPVEGLTVDQAKNNLLNLGLEESAPLRQFVI